MLHTISYVVLDSDYECIAGTAEEKEKRREKEHHRKQLDQNNIKALLKTMSSTPTQGAKSNLSSNIGKLLHFYSHSNRMMQFLEDAY